jgi:hypothetical protein
MLVQRFFITLVLFLSAANCFAQTKRALLIGINNYESNAGAHAAIKAKDTDGPSRWSLREWPTSRALSTTLRR